MTPNEEPEKKNEPGADAPDPGTWAPNKPDLPPVDPNPRSPHLPQGDEGKTEPPKAS